MQNKCPKGIIFIAATQILNAFIKMLFFITPIASISLVPESTPPLKVIFLVVFQVSYSVGLIRGWRWTHAFMTISSAVLILFGLLSLPLTTSLKNTVLGICVKIIVLIYILASRRVRHFFYGQKKKTDPNQLSEVVRQQEN